MPLHDNERRALRRVARQAVGRVSQRAHFVLMREQGMTQQQIADTMGYRLRTVQRVLMMSTAWRGCMTRRGRDARRLSRT